MKRLMKIHQKKINLKTIGKKMNKSKRSTEIFKKIKKSLIKVPQNVKKKRIIIIVQKIKKN